MRKEQEDMERTFKDRIQRAESQRLELEDELSRQKANMAAERMQMDSQITGIKQRIRSEEVSISHF